MAFTCEIRYGCLYRSAQKTRKFRGKSYPVRPMIYFDYNSTAPVMREAREAWLTATEQISGNPSSMHDYGARAAAALLTAREKLASYMGCSPADIIWTSGATEANNTVMHHFS